MVDVATSLTTEGMVADSGLPRSTTITEQRTPHKIRATSDDPRIKTAGGIKVRREGNSPRLKTAAGTKIRIAPEETRINA